MQGEKPGLQSHRGPGSGALPAAVCEEPQTEEAPGAEAGVPRDEASNRLPSRVHQEHGMPLQGISSTSTDPGVPFAEAHATPGYNGVCRWHTSRSVPSNFWRASSMSRPRPRPRSRGYPKLSMRCSGRGTAWAHITLCDFPVNKCRMACMALLSRLGFTANGFDPYGVAERCPSLPVGCAYGYSNSTPAGSVHWGQQRSPPGSTEGANRRSP